MLKNKKGLAIILSSPSGGGKSTIAKKLISMDKKLTLSVSATTRKPRPGDIEGVHYFFKSENEFVKMIKNDELVEYSEIYGNLYGIPKTFIETKFNLGNSIIFDIDSQGAYKLKKTLQIPVVSVFILPPSINELKRRLEIRNQDSPEEIKYRLNLAGKEIKHAKNYDHVVTNHDLLSTIKEIYNIIELEREKIK